MVKAKKTEIHTVDVWNMFDPGAEWANDHVMKNPTAA